MKRLLLIFALAATAGAPAMMSQAFFSVNAGTDGFNFNLSNVAPVYPAVAYVPVPVHHHHHHAHHPEPVCVPLRPGVSYVAPAPTYRRAAGHYRRAVEHGVAPGVGIYLPGGIFVGSTGYSHGYDYYDDDFDDDDFEEYVEHARKHHKKALKKQRKAIKKLHKKMEKHHKKEMKKAVKHRREASHQSKNIIIEQQMP